MRVIGMMGTIGRTAEDEDPYILVPDINMPDINMVAVVMNGLCMILYTTRATGRSRGTHRRRLEGFLPVVGCKVSLCPSLVGLLR